MSQANFVINHHETLEIFHYFRSIYRFSRIFGCTPFSFKFNSFEKVIDCEIKPHDFIWFLIVFITYIYMAYFRWSTLTYFDSGAIYIGDNWLIILGLIGNSISIALDMYNRHHFVQILKKFNGFDEKVNY